MIPVRENSEVVIIYPDLWSFVVPKIFDAWMDWIISGLLPQASLDLSPLPRLFLLPVPGARVIIESAITSNNDSISQRVMVGWDMSIIAWSIFGSYPKSNLLLAICWFPFTAKQLQDLSYPSKVGDVMDRCYPASQSTSYHILSHLEISNLLETPRSKHFTSSKAETCMDSWWGKKHRLVGNLTMGKHRLTVIFGGTLIPKKNTSRR